jgi:hypothetical protein
MRLHSAPFSDLASGFNLQCYARAFAGFWPPIATQASQGDEAVTSEVTHQEDQD